MSSTYISSQGPGKEFKSDISSADSLDILYYHILDSTTDVRHVLDVLSFFCFSNVAFPLGKGIPLLSEILCHDRRGLQRILNKLNFMLDVPRMQQSDEHPDDMKLPLRIVRKEVKEFLIDPKRSGKFYLDRGLAYGQLTQTFLVHLPTVFSKTQVSTFQCMLISCCLLIHTCINSTPPTEELWRDLFDLDLIAFLHLFRQTGGAQWDIYNQVSPLMNWFKEQDSFARDTLGFEKSLYLHHLAAWDQSISASLKPYFKQSYTSNLITAITHPSYLFSTINDYYIMLDILNYRLNNEELRNFDALNVYEGLWLFGGRTGKENAYIPMLMEFLQDRERARELYVDGEKYAFMARKIAEFVFEHDVPSSLLFQAERPAPLLLKHKCPKPQTTPQVFTYALQQLSFYLSRATYTKELAKYFSESSFDMPLRHGQKCEFDKAVKQYLSENSDCLDGCG